MLRFNLKIESKSSIASVSQVSVPNLRSTVGAYLSTGLSPTRQVHTTEENTSSTETQPTATG